MKANCEISSSTSPHKRSAPSSEQPEPCIEVHVENLTPPEAMAPYPPKQSVEYSTAADRSPTCAVAEPLAKKQRPDEPPNLNIPKALASAANNVTPSTEAPIPEAIKLKLKLKKPTLSLKLQFPKYIPNEEDRKMLARRKGAAKNWAAKGKLQRAFPKPSEIRNAYNLKLMRHYPGSPSCSDSLSSTLAASTSSASSVTLATSDDTTQSPASSVSTLINPSFAPNFIKPTINKSERVTNLLKNFPVDTAAPKPHHTSKDYAAYYDQWYIDAKNLKKNINITKNAVQLAWECFAEHEPDHPTRASLRESGLASTDLIKEEQGLPNNLPEWKKANTSKFTPIQKI